MHDFYMSIISDQRSTYLLLTVKFSRLKQNLPTPDLASNLYSRYSPALDDSNDIIDLDQQFVSFRKVLQGTHVCGHCLKYSNKTSLSEVSTYFV